MSELEYILACKNKLGEGPVWDEDEQKLYWVDIHNNSYWWLAPETGAYEEISVGVPIGVLALCSSGGLIMATQKGFALWNQKTRELTYLAQPYGENPAIRFNDGAVDIAGRFWAGTMSIDESLVGLGVLYRLDPDGTVYEMATGIGTSNGIGWNPDNSIMYFTDSPLKTIYAYDFDAATGNISNRRTFVNVSDDIGSPDGLAVDGEGYVWSARWDGAKLVRFTPDGKVDRVVEVPGALRPTSCVFGGVNLDELYITSASVETQDQEKYPLSGGLFRLKTGISGLPKHKFAG